MATPTEIYARPDVYEMDTKGAGDDAARFFKR